MPALNNTIHLIVRPVLLTLLVVLLLLLAATPAAWVQTATATVGVGTHPEAVAVNPVTNRVYVANAGVATIIVTSTADNLIGGDGLCTLREALRNANADADLTSGDCPPGTGTDTIVLVAGQTYTLALGGTGEDAAATGDLDVTDSDGLTITSNLTFGTATIDANDLDRIFDKHAGSGALTLIDLIIEDGTAPGFESGGGIQSDGGNLTLLRTTVRDNVSSDGGGIVANGAGTVSLDQSTLSGNLVGNLGGGLAAFGLGLVVQVTNSTISGNQASLNGGGMGVFAGAAATILHSTIAGNTATSGDGGGIFTDGDFGNPVHAVVRFSTIAGNMAGNAGGGIAPDFAFGGSFRMSSTILADNTAPSSPDCTTFDSSAGHNVVEDPSGCFFIGVTTGNVTGVDPGLGMLGDNGGLTQTKSIGTGSVAADLVPSGTDGCGTTETADQRGAGFTRPQSTNCDAGAFEAGTPTSTLAVTGSGTANGVVTGFGITCTSTAGAESGDCSQTYAIGTSTTMTATAQTGTFQGYTGTGSASACTTSPCTFTMNTASLLDAAFSTPPTTGTIIIAKESDPAGATGFSFTDDIEAPNSFTLNDGQTKTFTDVMAGQYTVTEDDPSWQSFALTALDCDDANSTENVGTRTATINLEAGETVTCTFTNRIPRGNLTVVKQASPNDGTDFDFTISGPGFATSTPVFLLQWGTFGSDDGQFNGPQGVAVDAAGNVYVADGSNHRIQKFDPDGNFLLAWGTFGSNDGQLKFPWGMAFDAAGNIYVADSGNNRIQKFDQNGNFLLAWGTGGSNDGQFNNPTGVAVDAAGNVYVADLANHRIQKFDSGGTFLTKWGSFNTNDGQFRFPFGVAVDAAGHVYVADTNNHRIQTFDSNGTFLTKWGTQGNGDGEFNGPTGVTFDAAGTVYVADNQNHRIQTFDSGGTFLTKWGTQGNGDGQFMQAIAVAVGAAGIYVADFDNHRIQKFASNSFTLDDEPGQPNDGVTDTEVFTDLIAGDYVITEQMVPGWDLASISCAGGAFVQDGRQVTVTVAEGASVTCTFTNNEQVSNGTIIIAKASDPAGGTDFAFTDDIAAPNSFTLDDGGTKTFTDVAPGSYSVTEAFPGPTYELATLTCDDGNSSGDVATRTAMIELEAGETVTCTFTNGLPADPGIIIIKKETDPAGDPGSFAFSGVVSGSIGHGGKLKLTGVAPGSYTVTEDDPSALGFTLTDISCTDANSTVDLATRTATLQVDPGEKLKCTFTNSVSAPPPPPPGDGCPRTAMITNYRPKRDYQQFVDITNVGQDAISLDDCSLISFNVQTEESIGAATVALSGPLGSMETFRVGSAGVGGVDLVWPDGAIPGKNGSLGLLNGPPVPSGTLREDVQSDVTTAVIYLSKKQVFGFNHWIDESLNGIYSCLYGDYPATIYPFTPVTDCSGVPVARMAEADRLEAATLGDLAVLFAGAKEAAKAEDAAALVSVAETPSSYALEANYPNPFNPQTVIRFGLPESAQVRLVVYDVLGRQVQVLAKGVRSAGWHEVTFEAGTLPSGPYLYRLETPSGSFTHRMLLVK